MKPIFWTPERDAVLIKNYGTKTATEIAAILGTSRRSVISRRHVIGSLPRFRSWTSKDIDFLRKWYSEKYGKKLELDRLAAKLKRDKHSVCRKARSLGLTKPSRPTGRKPHRKWPTDAESRAAIIRGVKKSLAVLGHPRGMLGKRHTKEAKERFRQMTTDRNASMTVDELRAMGLKGVKTKLAKYGKAGNFGDSSNAFSRCRRGRRDDLGGMFFRSAWEANYARYLNFLLSQGKIAAWAHEPDNFRFDGVKRGPYTYLPDFRVTENDGTIAYHEVKGWMDSKSRQKIKRFKKFFPTVKLVVIGNDEYKAIRATASTIIKHWEI